MSVWRRRLPITMAALAVLPLVPYAWAVHFPFISDDYVQIGLGEKFGPVSGWKELSEDALYRCRATSLIVTHWVKRGFGMEPAAFNVVNLAVHVLNVWLVLALGVWRVVGWRVSALAAAFVAIYEGHQEAVVWHAALPELLVFFFVLLTFVSWVLWLQRGGWGWYAASLASFLLALMSKESAVAAIGLMAIAVIVERRPLITRFLATAPFVLIAAAYAWGIFAARATHLHLNDGTFSFDAPVFTTWLRSFAGMLWFWGGLGLAFLLWHRNRRRMIVVLVALAWIGVALLPYSFLSYMPRVPSRHRYLASVGVALIVSVAFLAARRRAAASHRRWATAAAAAVVLLHNAGYLWIVKQRQFLERAEPTERIVAELSRSPDQIVVQCFPYASDVVEWAVLLHTGRRAESIIEGPTEACGRRLDIRLIAGPAQSMAR